MKKNDATYFGFDFGTSNVAIGMITEEDETFSDFIKFNSNADPYDIHYTIEKWLYSKFLEDESVWSPHYAFIEGVFKGPNQRTYSRMIRVAHSLNILLAQKGVSVQYINPAEWRKILFGKGNIKKEDCQARAIKMWPELLEFPKGEIGHRSDAMMVAQAGKNTGVPIEQKTEIPGPK